MAKHKKGERAAKGAKTLTDPKATPEAKGVAGSDLTKAPSKKREKK